MMIAAHEEKVFIHPIQKRLSRVFALILFLPVLLGLSSCYYQPYTTAQSSEPAVMGTRSVVPSTQVYFYPKHGQTTDQQSRDHYDCYNWAIQQTGFDPGQSTIPKNNRVKVVPMPPTGYDTVAMSIAGAVLGALIGGPRHAVEGALIGAAGGAVAGAASDTARQQQSQQMEEYYASHDEAQNRQLSEKVFHFRRAMSACLEGRGYTVQ
jgi:outer membrane lipoprotein SlyB